MALDCVRCDAFEWPDAGLRCYRVTPTFDAESVPAGLLRDHSTRRGTWGRIVVLQGQVGYVAGEREWLLQPAGEEGGAGIVVPDMKHHVVPRAGAVFKVEFWRPPS